MSRPVLAPFPFLALSLFLLPATARSQVAAPTDAHSDAWADAALGSTPPVSAGVVVTAEARPADLSSLPVAATVIDRAEIERSRATSVLDLLRTVPGVDLVQSGGPEGVTSLFLRGTNSNQALVLLDGVKLNSPYFGGVDLGTLAASNVDRVEIVRGPFSALYGSEAIGGVVQIFTRHASGAPVAVGGRFAAGNAGTKDGNAYVSITQGPVGFAGGFRRLLTWGDLPNQFFAATNLSGALDLQISPDIKVGLVGRRDTSRSGIPFSGDLLTPLRTTTYDSTTIAVPLTLTFGPGTTLEVQGSYGKDLPTYSDPDDPYFYTESRADARRTGGRAVFSHTFSSHRLSVGGDLEKTKVTSEDSYGVPLDAVTQSNWSGFAEDRMELFGRKVSLTVGLRFDHNDAFGGKWSPRAGLAWSLSPAFRLRASGGAAFRAPSAGELYYPFSGNPALQPERSTSYEAGADWTVARGLVLEVTAFTTSLTDLITYDFAAQENVNVGSARSRGIETVLSGELGKGVFVRASYSWIDAVDRETGLPLLRRPRNRASATFGQTMKDGVSAQMTVVYVGPRDDVDAVTFQRVTDSSYVRVDTAASGPKIFGGAVIFLRITNLLDRQYAEVAGFPSPGRRWTAGLDLSF